METKCDHVYLKIPCKSTSTASHKDVRSLATSTHRNSITKQQISQLSGFGNDAKFIKNDADERIPVGTCSERGLWTASKGTHAACPQRKDARFFLSFSRESIGRIASVNVSFLTTRGTGRCETIRNLRSGYKSSRMPIWRRTKASSGTGDNPIPLPLDTPK